MDKSPDLLLLDLQLPGGGLEAAEQIIALKGKTKIVVLSVVQDINSVARAFRIGVSGYLLKEVSGSELVRLAEAAAAGEHCVAPQLLGQLIDHLSGRTLPDDDPDSVDFGAREEQIMALVGRGLSNKEIAYKLSICEATIKYSLTNIMKKLHARNRVEVALFAAQRSPRGSNISAHRLRAEHTP